MFSVSGYIGALCLGNSERDNIGVSAVAKQWRAGKALMCLISLWIQINKQINPCINNLGDKQMAGSTAEHAAQWHLIKEAQQWQEWISDWGGGLGAGGWYIRKQEGGEAGKNFVALRYSSHQVHLCT